MPPFGLWFGDSHLGFGTHVPILASAVLQARPGPVLEYGMGLYSSPLLHMLCLETGRDLLSLDHDAAWIERFADFRNGQHQLAAFPTWGGSEEHVDKFAESWAVVFIDHGPDERRVVDAKRLADKAEFVLVHDWGGPPGTQLGESQQAIFDLFKYRWVSRLGPYTAVLSNVQQFAL